MGELTHVHHHGQLTAATLQAYLLFTMSITDTVPTHLHTEKSTHTGFNLLNKQLIHSFTFYTHTHSYHA